MAMVNIKIFSDIKRKGFEVLHRARQLGGEEAKAVIFATINMKDEKGNPIGEDKLKDELEVETGSISKNICFVNYDQSKNQIKIKLKEILK